MDGARSEYGREESGNMKERHHFEDRRTI